MMEGWNVFKLGELLEIKYGKDHKKLNDGEYPLYGSGGIMRYVDEFLYDDESILIPRKGTLTNLFYLNIPFSTVDTMFWSKIRKEKVFPKYLYYLLKTYDLSTLDVGAAIPSLTTKVLNEVSVKIPTDKETQQKIAAMLSAYDDLIENNLKRIKLLEEMAQQTYEEWFVRMRFPGYENAVMNEETGLPEGWEKVKLNEITSKIGDGLHGTPKYTEDGKYYFLNGNNLENGEIIIKSETKKISEVEFAKIKKPLNDRTILLAINGTLGNIGLYSGQKIALGKSACYINIAKHVSKLYIRYVLESQNFQSYAYLFATGSTIKNLGLKAIRDYKLNLPPSIAQDNSQSILFQFDNLVEPIYQCVKNLQNQNQRLKEARDILLPRLMSGMIEV